MIPTSNDNSGFVEFIKPEDMSQSKIHFSGRFDYSREKDRTIETFSTIMGEVTIGMWLGGENKIQQQDAVIVAEDNDENLWMAVADGLGGHSGGAEASQICCDVIREEIENFYLEMDNNLRTKIRNRMMGDQVIMSNPDKPGGACLAVVCISTLNNKLKSYSLGDVEVSVHRNGSKIVLVNTLDSQGYNSAVTKTISPSINAEFTYSETILEVGDRVMVHSDGLSNKAFRAFGIDNETIDRQIDAAIKLSQIENGVDADNLSIACLNNFRPKSAGSEIFTVKLRSS